jgi:phenylacetate-CoA ligase
MQDSRRVIPALQAFLDTSLNETPITDIEEKILALFHSVAATVPAYKKFLRERAIDPATITTLADFHSLPLITKENYLHRYPLAELCRGGQLESCDFIAVSSGTTGNPSFWPRFLTDEYSIALRFERVFRDSFQADRYRTLAVVCFPMGTWVGGMFTANCCRHLAAKGYPITVITPGNNKTEILRVVGELGVNFDRVVLLGYPPFLKEVIDTGIANGIQWARYRIKLVFAGEVFSEEWRDLVGERAGATDTYYDSASLYGTADAGVLGNETPLSICIRRFLSRNLDSARDLFGQTRLPTLVQYDPASRFFEAIDGTLVFSGDNGIPLIRYGIGDTGGIIPYSEMLDFLRDRGFDPLAELPDKRGISPLPFVYVFGRSRFTLSFFGANIYVENVALGLEQPEVNEWVTGKFVMEIRSDADKNGIFVVTVELVPGTIEGEGMKEAIATAIRTQLCRVNSEFAHYVPVDRQTPEIVLLPTGDPEYFPIGVKHRYSR